MNERIRELESTARSWAKDEIAYLERVHNRDYTFDEASNEFNKKFAEMIVRECVRIVAKRKDQAIDDGCNVDEAMSMAEMDLLEHFGVEL